MIVVFCRPPSVKNPIFPFPTVKIQKLAKAIWEFWDWLDFRIAALYSSILLIMRCIMRRLLCTVHYAPIIQNSIKTILFLLHSHQQCSTFAFAIYTNTLCGFNANTFYSNRTNIIWYLIIHCIMHNYAEFNIDHCAQSRLLNSHQ